ncbi:MAG: acetoacetate--CoA ligase, partial [Gammaproteobacteria bacterium]|nr:acetoacetate--CoA ligase [Gammaproteobacteria bacterium]
QLWREVARVASALRAAGVSAEDRVAAYMPNIPETVIAMLAASSIGATFSSCSPDFGVQGVLDRFGQIEPKVLFTVDGYHYNGKAIPLGDRLEKLAQKLPSVERIIVTEFLGDTPVPLDNAIGWDEFGNPTDKIEFAALPFDHPLYIMYSSGTTGAPKCIVHGAGGTLLQHLKELVLHTDLGPRDRIFFFTTCGWMMWNWLVSSLASGATIVLYDGSPFHPDPEVLWRLAADEELTVFGTSAKYLAALEKAGVRPRQRFDLRNLRAVLSTGSPLAPESYDYVYREISDNLQLSSISGGTDIISCFALGNPVLPVRRGELQCRGLGMAVQIYNDAGQPVENEKGELVCTRPFPSMPLGFFNDPDGSRYRAAYFDRFANTWWHGDYALLTRHNGVVIYGRSDAVLNPGGVRIGTAEIYRQVEKLDFVLESIAVGQDWRDDQRVVLFVRLRDGELTDERRQAIRDIIRSNTTPRHVPAVMVAVEDIPRTISGKIVELAVQNVIHGREVTNTEALANPEALALYRDLPELQAD